MPDIPRGVEPGTGPGPAGLGGGDEPGRRSFADPSPSRIQETLTVRPGVLPPGLAGQIAHAAEPLPAFDDPAFGRLFDRFGDAQVVMLGEATRGTSEFYRGRAAITRWLVEKRGFDIVALEADWSDGRVLDARVRNRRQYESWGKGEDAALARFPSWIWRNAEFEAFLTWLARHNSGRPPGAQTAIHGLDVYNLAGSLSAVVDYLDGVDPEAARMARERYGCLTPWAQDPETGGAPVTPSSRYASWEGVTIAMLSDMLGRQLRETAGSDEVLLDAPRSARLVGDAEAHYRAMYYGGAEAWNQRDRHMFDSLRTLLEARPRDAKAVVWAHNAHVGDTRATEMGQVRGQLSLGQHCREAYGQAVQLVGFGTHGGTVAGASAWDGPMEIREVPAAVADSQERQAHNAGVARFLLDLRPNVNSSLRHGLSDPRLERFIGAIYRPKDDRWRHYANCRLPEQFDGWVWFDRTTAVTPLQMPEAR